MLQLPFLAQPYYRLSSKHQEFCLDCWTKMVAPCFFFFFSPYRPGRQEEKGEQAARFLRSSAGFHRLASRLSPIFSGRASTSGTRRQDGRAPAPFVTCGACATSSGEVLLMCGLDLILLSRPEILSLMTSFFMCHTNLL